MRIFLLFLLFFLSADVQAQHLNGSYRYVNPGFSGARTITFLNGNFTEEIQEDLIVKKGTGSYILQNGRLLLTYLPYPKQDSSAYEITASANGKEMTMVEINVFDENGLPMQVQFGCRDNKNEPLLTAFTDKNGIGNMLLFKHPAIGYFVIDALGYYRIHIPVKHIMGKTVNIKAYLRPQTAYYIPPGKIDYKITHQSDKKLIISEGKNNFTFLKIIR